MARPTPTEIEALRDARDDLHRLAAVYHLPLIEPLEFISTVLPMGNKHSTTQEKADAYHLFMHGQYLGDSYEWWTSGFCETSGPEFGAGNSNLDPASISEVGRGEIGDFVSTQATLAREIDTFWEEHADERSEFRNMLDCVFDGEPEDTETYLNRNYEKLVLVPTMNWVGTELELTFRYCPIGIGGILGYGLALLVNREPNNSKYLRICSLESCDNYFLSKRMPKNRKRNLKYCSDAHTKDGTAKKNAESSATYRKKQAKKPVKNAAKGTER